VRGSRDYLSKAALLGVVLAHIFGGGALSVKKFWLSPIRASKAWALGLELTLQVGSFVVENLPHTTR
jgi:hypothetical protein